VAASSNSRQYPTAYKLKALKRAEGGEGVLPVARKLADIAQAPA
jgi:transposase